MSAHRSTPPPRVEAFGRLPDGSEVQRWTLSDDSGVTASVLTFGAILQSLDVPDRQGQFAGVVLGLPRLEDYLGSHPYLGATVGRYANRIAGGSFTLDGKQYALPLSDPAGPNTLHGGQNGFDKRLWQARPLSAGPGAAVELSRTSPDGEEGFPGTLHAVVRYTLYRAELRIDYQATTDAPTVVGMTNHSYFNLAGEGSPSVLDHRLQIAADRYLPVDRHLIPEDRPRPVAATPFDFTAADTLGARIGSGDEQLGPACGYDHCWILDGGRAADCRTVARLTHPGSGRGLSIATTEPGLQVYTANGFDGTLTGLGGRPYLRHSAVALETQPLPDSPNRPDFPTVVLRPGLPYRSTTVYRFFADQPTVSSLAVC